MKKSYDASGSSRVFVYVLRCASVFGCANERARTIAREESTFCFSVPAQSNTITRPNEILIHTCGISLVGFYFRTHERERER